MEDVSGRLQHVEESLLRCLSVLEPFLPYLNAHNTDFITHGHWEHYIDENIANEVLKLTGDELEKLPSGTLTLEDQKSSADSGHNVNSNCYTTLEKRVRWPQRNLADFLSSIASCTLPKLVVDTSLESFLKDDLTISQHDAVSIHHYISEKKCHEVDIMADVCARLAKAVGTKQVVDVGSGKGYLSSRMALMYGLQVLGVDASNSFTNSANDRNAKLTKKWDGFVKTAKAKGSGVKGKNGVAPKRHESGNLRQDISNSASSVSVGEVANSSTENSCRRSKNCEASSEQNRSEDLKLNQGSSKSSTDNKSLNCDQRENSPNDNFKERDISSHLKSKCDIKDVSVSSFNIGANNLPGSDALDIDRINLVRGQSSSDRRLENVSNTCDKTDMQGHDGADAKTKKGIYIPLTQFIDSKTDLKTLVTEHFGSDHGKGEVLLTGLHTCGNLAPSMLRIFTENSDVASICNVGCCYQHLDEFGDEPKSSDIGFPMSSLLRARHVQLGRNARMLASQPMDRSAMGGINSKKSLFWRAVLQQILVDLTGGDRKDWRVGKIYKKCSSFITYVRKALNKLDMHEENQKLTDTQIEAYLTRYAGEEKKTFAFFQMRACFGPLVEAVIILDRLLFLLEQDHISEAYLTRLFDPVQSPRCYGIIGIKKFL